MDMGIVQDLQQIRQCLIARHGGDAAHGKLFLFGDIGGQIGKSVNDPYSGPDGGFENVYDQI